MDEKLYDILAYLIQKAANEPDIAIEELKGKDGRGIKNIRINLDQELIIRLDDNTTINAGKLPKGETGEKGEKGEPGKDGVSISGKDGIDGLPGKDGRYVREINSNADGNLIFTMSDGEQIFVKLPESKTGGAKRWGGGGTTKVYVDAAILAATQDLVHTIVAGSNISVDSTDPANPIVSASGLVSTTLTNAHILVGNASNIATDVALSGDATLANTGAITLATVNSTVGSFGSSNVIPTITVNAKGLITAVNSNFVVAPAGTLTGSTLASGVTASSLTSFGNSPSFVTPLLGTPTSGVLTNCTGLPLTTGITGILPIANGGTNTNTQTSFGMCYYDGTKLTTSPYATISFIAGDIDLLIIHPSVTGTVYEVLVTSSSSQYIMSYNTASTFQGICGTAATENYWTLSTKGLGLSVSAVALWFGSTSNDDMSFYRNNTERLRLTTTGIYVPDVAYLSAASPTINAMVTGTTLIQSSVRLISAYSGAASANSSYFLGSGNDGGLLQVFGAGGTIASPTALTTDSRMGGIFGRGYAATGYSNAAAAVTFHAESTFTDTSTPTYIAFATTASGATTRTEAMRITSAGNLLLGTTSTSARITLGGSPVMQTLIRNDATLTASGNNADQYGFINYNNMTFTGGSANYATGHYADLKVNVPGGATVVYAQALVAIGPTNLGAGSVTHAKALRATAPTVGTASNVAAALANVSIGGSYGNTTPPADGAIIQGNVGIGTTLAPSPLRVAGTQTNDDVTTARQVGIGVDGNATYGLALGYSYKTAVSWRGVIQALDNNNGVPLLLNPSGGNVGIGTTNPGAALDVKSNGGTINLTGTDHTYIQFYPDGAAAGRKGYLGYPAAGIDDIYVANEISGADIILLTNGGNVGIGTTGPTTKLNIKESGTNNAVVFIEPGTWAPGYYAEIRFGDANHYIRGEWGAGINIYDVNRIALTGSNVGIGTTNPGSKLQVTADANIGSNWNNSQLRIGGATNSNYRLNLGYDTTNNLGVIQPGEDGVAYKNLALNPNGGNVGIGTTTPANLLTLANNNYIAWRNGANSGETVGITSTSVDDMQFYVTATQLTITSGGNVVIGNQNALATNATNGFMYIRTCAGTPTGVPTAYTGHVAMLYDTTNNKLYAYNGAWKSVTLT